MRKFKLSREKFQFKKTLTWQVSNTCRLSWRDWQWHIKILVLILYDEMCQHFKICLTQWTYISKWTITNMTNSCLDMSSLMVQREQRLISNSMETIFLCILKMHNEYHFFLGCCSICLFGFWDNISLRLTLDLLGSPIWYEIHSNSPASASLVLELQV